jgi:predicted ATPase
MEISTIRQMILRQVESLLTIVGPPGVGKTPGFASAASLRDELEGGVFMVPLASVAI